MSCGASGPTEFRQRSISRGIFDGFSRSRSQYLPPWIGAAIVAGAIALILFHLDQEPIARGDIKLYETIADSTSSDAEPVAETDLVLPELTHSVASRALTGFAKYREHFSEVELYAFERIDDVIANSERGRVFLRDLNGLGFETVSEWRSILVILDVTFRAMTEEEGVFNVSNGDSARETETHPSITFRKIVTELLENETNRALLGDLVRIE